MNPSLPPLRLAVLAALAVAATATRASVFLTEHLTGSLPADTTLGGTALGADTPYSITATFDADPAANLYPGNLGFGAYPFTSFSITLDGIGTFAGVPGSYPAAIFFDLNYAQSGAGILAGNGNIGHTFSGVSSAFDATAPSPVTFTPPSISYISGEDVTPISLLGVTGGLVVPPVSDTRGATPTASITAVPEPSEYAAVAGLALGVFALVRRSLQAAAQN